MNPLLQRFKERTTAELELSRGQVAWWNGLVARGLVKVEHARGHIEAEKRIIATKQFVLDHAF